MADVSGSRSGLALNCCNSKLHQVGAVELRVKANSPDTRRLRIGHKTHHLVTASVADDRNIPRSAAPNGFCRTDRAFIIDGSDQHALRGTRMEELLYRGSRAMCFASTV